MFQEMMKNFPEKICGEFSLKNFLGEDGKCDPEKIKEFMSNMGCCPTDSDKGCGCGEIKEEEAKEETKKEK